MFYFGKSTNDCLEFYFVQEWSYASYPPWAHGPGYIISRDVAKFIVKGHHERMLKVWNPVQVFSLFI